MRILLHPLCLVGLLLSQPAYAADKTSGQLSVMWRIVQPDYDFESPVVSPDGRTVAYVRKPHNPVGTEPDENQVGKRLLGIRKQEQRTNPWFGTQEVMLVEPGRSRPRRIAYGTDPQFVRGGKALEFSRYTRPHNAWICDDFTQQATIDLQSGKIEALTRETRNVNLYHVNKRTRRPWFWANFAKRYDTWWLTSLSVSDTASSPRRTLIRLDEETAI